MQSGLRICVLLANTRREAWQFDEVSQAWLHVRVRDAFVDGQGSGHVRLLSAERVLEQQVGSSWTTFGRTRPVWRVEPWIAGEVVLSVSVRFYGALNDFLPAARRQATLVCALGGSASVKDLVETLGVPHAEIDLIVVNSRPVDFTCRLRDGDRVAVYPPFRAFDLGDDVRLGPAPQAEPRFVADVHLGRLAAYLRLAGVDTAYRNDYADHELVAISASEDRTLLTRDVGVLKHGLVIRGYFVRETQPGRQLLEVLGRFDLVKRAEPFTRCLRCNSPLHVVPKEQVEHLLPPRTREHYREFSRCPACARIYWRGSHYSQMSLFLETVFAAVGSERRRSPS